MRVISGDGELFLFCLEFFPARILFLLHHLEGGGVKTEEDEEEELLLFQHQRKDLSLPLAFSTNVAALVLRPPSTLPPPPCSALSFLHAASRRMAGSAKRWALPGA